MNAEEQARNRYARRLTRSLSYEARLARFVALQRACMKEIRSNPAGWTSFMRRNLRKRAV